jgi:hypothetical protein
VRSAAGSAAAEWCTRVGMGTAAASTHTAGERLAATIIIVGGVGGLGGRGHRERGVGTEGDPEHERGDRKLDQPKGQDQHPSPCVHRFRCYYDAAWASLRAYCALDVPKIGLNKDREQPRDDPEDVRDRRGHDEVRQAGQ